MLFTLIGAIYDGLAKRKIAKTFVEYSSEIKALTVLDVLHEDEWKRRFKGAMEVLEYIAEHSNDDGKVLKKMSKDEINNMKLDLNEGIGHLMDLGDRLFGFRARKEMQEEVLGELYEEAKGR